MARVSILLLLLILAECHTLAFSLCSGAGRSELLAIRRIRSTRFSPHCAGRICLRGGQIPAEVEEFAGADDRNSTSEADKIGSEDGEVPHSSDDLADVATNRSVYEAAFGFRASSRVGMAGYNLAITLVTIMFARYVRSNAMSKEDGIQHPFIANLITYILYLAAIVQVPPFLYLAATSLPELSEGLRYAIMLRDDLNFFPFQRVLCVPGPLYPPSLVTSSAAVGRP
jgi:hypothetical protein